MRLGASVCLCHYLFISHICASVYFNSYDLQAEAESVKRLVNTLFISVLLRFGLLAYHQLALSTSREFLNAHWIVFAAALILVRTHLSEIVPTLY